MKYDFDTRVDRSGMASIRELMTPESVKEKGMVSFWGAEFEFQTAPCVTEAIVNWARKGLAAYNCEDEAFFALVKNWMKLHRGWEIETDWIVPTYGLSFSVGTIARAFTEPGDGFIGLGPVYHMTWEPIELNDRKHVDCPLLFDGETYHIDYEKLETLLAEPSNKVLTLCNPHNPIARVWNREELTRLAELVYRYDKILYSDEIFADTVYEGVEMLTIDQVTDKPVKWIVATSLGKTFSMTGVGQANIIIKDKALRDAFLKQRDKDHYGSFDPMMRAAYFGGYTEEGSSWVKAMMAYCWGNYELLDSFCKEYIPKIKVIRPQGTYIVWADCSGFGFDSAEKLDDFFKSAGFVCDQGVRYGSEPGFVRINLAAPRAELLKVLSSLQSAVKNLSDKEGEGV